MEEDSDIYTGRYYGEKRFTTKSRTKKHSILFKFIVFIFVCILACAAFIGFMYINTPSPRLGILKSSSEVSMIKDSQNKVIWKSAPYSRVYAHQSDIPSSVKDALLSIEDRNFYHESGVNYLRTAKAAGVDILRRQKAQGGSTLTQQLIKLSYFSTSDSDKTLSRKVKEMVMAEKLNQQYSKDEILQLYVNKVYMSDGLFGMQTASKYYFGKPLSHINISQAALLAGMAQAPNSYNPYLHPSAAVNRRNTVLRAMLDNKKITRSDYDVAVSRKLSSDIIPYKIKQKQSISAGQKSLLTDAYVRQVIKQAKSDDVNLQEDSAVVKTPLNLKYQQKLYDIVNNDDSIGIDNDGIQIAATMVDNNNGNVLAQIGGRHVDKLGSFDRSVNDKRSSGSTIKPLLDYGPAIDMLNWNPGTIVSDSPYTYPGTNVQLKDWDNRYQGNITVRKALVGSRNIPAVRTFMQLGTGITRKYLNDLGLDNSKDELVGSNAIGVNASSTQMAAAYTSLAHEGTYSKPNYLNSIDVNDAKNVPFGNMALPNKPKFVFSDSTAFMITDILKGVLTDPEGTGIEAKIDGVNSAGKTGTVAISNKMDANNVSDAWFVGYTKQYTIAVWAGYDDPSKGLNEQESIIPQHIYKGLMSYAMEGKPSLDWSIPDDVSRVRSGSGYEYAIQ